MTDEEIESYKAFVTRLCECENFLALVSEDAKRSAQFALELGTAILLEKPILIVALKGAKIPAPLRRIAMACAEAQTPEDTGKALESLLQQMKGN